MLFCSLYQRLVRHFRKGRFPFGIAEIRDADILYHLSGDGNADTFAELAVRLVPCEGVLRLAAVRRSAVCKLCVILRDRNTLLYNGKLRLHRLVLLRIRVYSGICRRYRGSQCSRAEFP